jgi:hypothetical protein
MLPTGLKPSSIVSPLINPLACCLSRLSAGNSVKVAQFTRFTTSTELFKFQPIVCCAAFSLDWTLGTNFAKELPL